MNQTVSSLYECIHRLANVQSADHAECVEGEALEILAATLGIRPRSASRRTCRLGRIRSERRAQSLLVRNIREDFVRRDLGQWFDTNARPCLDFVDLLVEVIHATTAGGKAKGDDQHESVFNERSAHCQSAPSSI